MKIHTTFFDKVLSLLAFLANLALFVMMIITVVDIIGRSVFNAPILGSVEVTQVSLAIMIVCTFPLIVHDESHISVDLLDNIIPHWLAPWRQLCVHLMSAVVLSLLTWQLYKYAARAFRYGDVTEFLRIPTGYVLAVMAFMGAISVLVSLLRVWHYIGVIFTPSATNETAFIISENHSKEHPHD